MRLSSMKGNKSSICTLELPLRQSSETASGWFEVLYSSARSSSECRVPSYAADPCQQTIEAAPLKRTTLSLKTKSPDKVYAPLTTCKGQI